MRVSIGPKVSSCDFVRNRCNQNNFHEIPGPLSDCARHRRLSVDMTAATKASETAGRSNPARHSPHRLCERSSCGPLRETSRRRPLSSIPPSTHSFARSFRHPSFIWSFIQEDETGFYFKINHTAIYLCTTLFIYARFLKFSMVLLFYLNINIAILSIAINIAMKHKHCSYFIFVTLADTLSTPRLSPLLSS